MRHSPHHLDCPGILVNGHLRLHMLRGRPRRAFSSLRLCPARRLPSACGQVNSSLVRNRCSVHGVPSRHTASVPAPWGRRSLSAFPSAPAPDALRSAGSPACPFQAPCCSQSFPLAAVLARLARPSRFDKRTQNTVRPRRAAVHKNGRGSMFSEGAFCKSGAAVRGERH